MRLITDTQIREDVLRKIRMETGLNGADIDVHVEQYHVTLTGTTCNTSQKLIAYDLVMRVDGIFGVTNNLEVRPDCRTRSDDEIAGELRQAFTNDSRVPDERIQTTVSHGWVGLEGKVDYTHEREEAEQVARRLVGVRGVYNRIEVNAGEAKPDNVRAAITAELKRRAELEAQNLRVSINGGTVTVSGRVNSWAEERAVIAAACQAPGVRLVKDKLRIDRDL